MSAETLDRRTLPSWPRLMSEPMAAAYLSIGATTLREHGPKAKRYGRRVLYDVRDLDRWADALDGQPLDAADRDKEIEEERRRFFERRNARG